MPIADRKLLAAFQNAATGDPEAGHSDMDEALIQYVRDTTPIAGRIIAIWDNSTRWYA